MSINSIFIACTDILYALTSLLVALSTEFTHEIYRDTLNFQDYSRLAAT